MIHVNKDGVMNALSVGLTNIVDGRTDNCKAACSG
jgi:hypothetical protein